MFNAVLIAASSQRIQLVLDCLTSNLIFVFVRFLVSLLSSLKKKSVHNFLSLAQRGDKNADSLCKVNEIVDGSPECLLT